MSEKTKTRIILILIAIIGLSATGLVCVLINPYSSQFNSKEATLSTQHYEYAEKAIEIADSYLDFDCSTLEAYYAIDALTNRKDELPNTLSPNSESNNILVESKVTRLYSYLALAINDSTSEDYQQILDVRNELAELIGEKTR